MTSCTDGTYCCGHNNLTCCGTQWAVKVPLLTSTTTTTITTTATASPSSQSNVAIYAGLGGALGLVVLVSAGLVLYLVRHIKKLKGQVSHQRGEFERLANSNGIGSGTSSPRFGTTSLSPLHSASVGGSGMGTGTSNPATPWTISGGGGSVGGTGGGENFKGLYDPPFVTGAGYREGYRTGVGQGVGQGLGQGHQGIATEMALSPPRSELDGSGAGFGNISIALARGDGQAQVHDQTRDSGLMEAGRLDSVRSKEASGNWGRDVTGR